VTNEHGHESPIPLERLTERGPWPCAAPCQAAQARPGAVLLSSLSLIPVGCSISRWESHSAESRREG
jgi:hypothetical protein